MRLRMGGSVKGEEIFSVANGGGSARSFLCTSQHMLDGSDGAIAGALARSVLRRMRIGGIAFGRRSTPSPRGRGSEVRSRSRCSIAHLESTSE